jgi:cardiolipin synthase A/B
VRSLRCELVAEHLGQEAAHLDAHAALQLYQFIARENRRRRDTGDPLWQGIAYRLDPATYGRHLQNEDCSDRNHRG